MSNDVVPTLIGNTWELYVHRMGTEMGNTQDIEFTHDQKDLARRITSGIIPLSGREIYALDLDFLLLEQKFKNWIRPQLAEMSGFKQLHNHDRKGVETVPIWKDAMNETGLRDMWCVRLTSHGIPLYHDGKEDISILVFLTKRGEWITAIHTKPSTSDWYWPRNFVFHRTLQDLYQWSEELIKDENLDRFDSQGETFVIKLAQSLDDLLDRTIAEKDEVLDDLRSAREGSRTQNSRFLGDPDYNTFRSA